jgi:uncharacterized protein (DUF433 family)
MPTQPPTEDTMRSLGIDQVPPAEPETQIVTCSPRVMGGTPVFAGTRVPVQTLLDYLEAGDSIDDFLDGFPTVSREAVVTFLEAGAARVVASDG